MYVDSISQNLKNPMTAWLLVAMVATASLVGWYAIWGSAPLTAASIFPLFGLLAWSVMWVHYVYGAMQLRYDFPEPPSLYHPLTYTLVLALILLHPLLFNMLRYQQTGLLPPESYVGYVGESNVIFVLLGTFALLLFLSFEVVRHLRNNKTIRKYWHIISITQVVAMVSIYIHALALGDIVTSTGFMAWWSLLGVTFVPAAYIVASNDWQRRTAR